MLCFLTIGIGIVFMAVALGAHAPAYSLIVPAVIILSGLIALKVAGLPLIVVVDHTKKELAVKVPPPFGRKYDTTIYPLDRIRSVELVESSKSGAVERGEADPGTYAIFLGLKDRRFVPICPYHPKSEYRAEAVMALRESLGAHAAAAKAAAGAASAG